MNPALNRNFEHEARIRRARIEQNLPVDLTPIRWPWINPDADVRHDDHRPQPVEARASVPLYRGQSLRPSPWKGR